jgi:hypothetical protein
MRRGEAATGQNRLRMFPSGPFTASAFQSEAFVRTSDQIPWRPIVMVVAEVPNGAIPSRVQAWFTWSTDGRPLPLRTLSTLISNATVRADSTRMKIEPTTIASALEGQLHIGSVQVH